jgi:hypothetical protein
MLSIGRPSSSSGLHVKRVCALPSPHPIHRHPRLPPQIVPFALRGQFMLPRVFNAQDSAKRNLQPPVHNAVQLARSVGWVCKGYVIYPSREPLDVRYGILFEDPSAAFEGELCHIRFEGVHAGRSILHKISFRGTSRQCLETERS